MTESFVYRLLQDYGNHRKGAEIAVYSEGEKVALENPEIAEKIPFEEAEIPRSILKILKTPDFLDKCVAEVGKRVAGEMPTIKAIGLFSAGRLVQNCEASSFNFALNDESGLGKDYVSGKTLSLFVPEPLFIYRSRISPTALTYMHDSRREPEWSWDGKVLFLEDVGENVLNAEVLKTFLTGGSFATVVIRQRAEDIKIQGKPVIGCTFANSAMKNETVRRLQLIRMDGSAEQTLRIKTFKKKIAQIGKNEEYGADILTAIATLKRVSVVIPELITRSLDAFPDVSIVRTNSGRFFDLIRASTAFHQFQRAKNSDGFVIAATQDYELAAEIFCNLVGSRNMTPLTRNQQKLLPNIDNGLAGKSSFGSTVPIGEGFSFLL